MTKHATLAHAAYLITFNPKFRYPFFHEDVLCHILATVIRSSQNIKDYVLIGYKINPDHVHILLRCGGKNNLSKIVQSIKRISSTRINQIRTRGTEDERKNLEWSLELEALYQVLVLKYDGLINVPFPLFDWQDGFDDRYITSRRHLKTVIAYLRKQAHKHHLHEEKYLFVSKVIPGDIRYPGEM